MEQAELNQLERAVDHEIRARFPEGAVERAVLLQHGDDPGIGPGELMVRVLIPAPGPPRDYQQALAAWEETQRDRLDALRRELSLRLPPARLLEITFGGTAPGIPRLSRPDDGSVTRMTPREVVTAALRLLRENYVFPERAGQAAVAIEARLAAGEYDGLDEVTLTGRLTSHLHEVCPDRTGTCGWFSAAPARGRTIRAVRVHRRRRPPTRMFPISHAVAISVPFARSVNPVAGTNWEGTGVLPDVAVPADEAFGVGYGKALEHVLSCDVPPPLKEEAREALARLRIPLPPAGPPGHAGLTASNSPL